MLYPRIYMQYVMYTQICFHMHNYAYKKVFISLNKNTLLFWYIKKVDTLIINTVEKHTRGYKQFDITEQFGLFWRVHTNSLLVPIHFLVVQRCESWYSSKSRKFIIISFNHTIGLRRLVISVSFWFGMISNTWLIYKLCEKNNRMNRWQLVCHMLLIRLTFITIGDKIYGLNNFIVTLWATSKAPPHP